MEGANRLNLNLVHSPDITMNAVFTQNSITEDIHWMNSLTIIAHNILYQETNYSVVINFDDFNKSITIEDNEQLNAEAIQSIRIERESVRIIFQDEYKLLSAFTPAQSHHIVSITIKEIELVFTIEYTGNNHLNIVFKSIPYQFSEDQCSYHGLIGQFFCGGYEVDTYKEILIFPNTNQKVVPVWYIPIQSFLPEMDGGSKQYCWMTMSRQDIIQGTYLDYVVPFEDLILE